MKKIVVTLLALTLTAFAALAEADRVPITVVNTAGEPIPGVVLIACTPTLCTQGITDENGEYLLPFESADVEIHISAAPEGIAFDEERIYTGEDIQLPIVLEDE